MTTLFPGALDDFTNPLGTDGLAAGGHAAMHGNVHDAIEALEAVIGTSDGIDPTSITARLEAVEAGGVGVSDHGALTGLADDDHSQYHTDSRGDARYAPIAKGVTNGNSHNHDGGDGAQIAYSGLSGLPTLGGAAALNVGTTTGTVAAGDDARLSDARVPTAHAHATSDVTGFDNAVGDIVDGAISDNGLLGYVSVANAAGVFIVSPHDTSDEATNTTIAITTSSLADASGIGRVAKPSGATGRNSDPNVAADATKEIPWSDDTGYVSGSASVASIVGGYDHVCNQIAGAITGGGHNYIQYDAAGHSIISGGSSNRIASGRSGIFGGTDCTIKAAATSSVIAGGIANTISSTNGSVIGGSNHIVSGIGAIVNGGNGNTAGANYSGIFSGVSNTTISGGSNSVILGGASNVVGASATYSLVSGNGNAVSHTLSTVLGRDGISYADNSFSFSRVKLVVPGDAQTINLVMGVRTTNTTLTNLTTSLVPPAVKTVFGIRSTIIGMEEATGLSAMYTWEGVAQWDGSAATTFYDSTGTGATRNFTQIVDNIGCAAVPIWAGNVTLRPKVTGKDATNIKWVATIHIVITRL